MKCDEIQKRLTAYVDDELDAVSKDNIKYHLKECPLCKARLKETTKMLKLYKSMPELKPQVEDFERIMETVTSVRGYQKKTRIMSKLVEWFSQQKKVVRWAPAAAILIIFVLIGTFILRPLTSKKPLVEKSTTVYTYHEYVAKQKPDEAKLKFGKYSFISIH
jgi:anti-sigma factor RsiW